jgi:hypothetical protein
MGSATRKWRCLAWAGECRVLVVSKQHGPRYVHKWVGGGLLHKLGWVVVCIDWDD